MIARKILHNYQDYRFGFEVILKDIPAIQVRGEWLPDINANALRWAVLIALAHKPGRLTGAEIRFVRHLLEKTTTAFGELMGVTHPAVIKWEEQLQQPTKMAATAEFRVRFLILENLPPHVRDSFLDTEENTTPTPKSILNKLDEFWNQATAAYTAPAPVEVPAQWLSQQFLPLTPPHTTA